MSSIGLNVEHKHCALYALSADPITFGHINIVERVSRIFDEVIVGIGSNPAKSYLGLLLLKACWWTLLWRRAHK
jgi:hypothetical protein